MDLVYCYKLTGGLKFKLHCTNQGSVVVLVYTHKCIFTEYIGYREKNWFFVPPTVSKTSYTTCQYKKMPKHVIRTQEQPTS